MPSRKSIMAGAGKLKEPEYVGSATNENTGTTAFSVDISGIDFRSGDLLILSCCADSGDTGPDINWNETMIQHWYEDRNGIDGGLWSRVLDGTEGTISSTETSTDWCAAAVIYRNVSVKSTFNGVWNWRVVYNTSGSPNAPILYNTWSESFILAIGQLDDDGTALTAPTGYTERAATEVGGSGSGSSIIIAERDAPNTGGDIDPGIFGGTGSDTWQAFTVELRHNDADDLTPLTNTEFDGGNNDWTNTNMSNWSWTQGRYSKGSWSTTDQWTNSTDHADAAEFGVTVNGAIKKTGISISASTTYVTAIQTIGWASSSNDQKHLAEFDNSGENSAPYTMPSETVGTGSAMFGGSIDFTSNGSDTTLDITFGHTGSNQPSAYKYFATFEKPSWA